MPKLSQYILVYYQSVNKFIGISIKIISRVDEHLFKTSND